MPQPWMCAMLALAAIAATAGEYPKPKPPADTAGYGQHIQRTMTLLATSTPEKRHKVRILFYGQSITVQPWWKRVEADLRRRFPHADLECANLAIGGFASQLLVRTAEYDLYPFYPDLLIFHVYGHHVRYEDIIRRTRERTTAEILIQTDHVTKEAEDDWTKKMNYTFLPAYAARYGCQLSRIRESWKQYLADRALKPQQLLRDGVHLNEHGEFLMAELVNQELVYRPDLPQDEWKGLVRDYAVGDDVKWEGDRLTLEFEGNRVVALAEPTGGGKCRVLLDGRRPSEFPELYYHARPTGTANIGWPAIKAIGHEKPLVLEEWTATCTGFNDAADEFRFSVVGSVTGPDGEGTAKERFVSKSGRIVIQPDDWVFAYDRKVSNKPTPDGFKVRWRVLPLFRDEFEAPTLGDYLGQELPTTLAQGLPNTRHKLELVGKAALKAIRIYKPPIRAQAEP
ncbi:MAG TPA: SGNH/GDSL hydrolase family protein [Planctomycetota bacterium]|nr:SGNH/GDSL hydrolase family protein [Planctomycetota bacterium]HRR79130.1 SGNH/GDSL hydrolase family protein [Planctomycetota bacterium]HRT95975.1 SGNH/GDSL hydrolase family protein [Planctomycetota bacterium]